MRKILELLFRFVVHARRIGDEKPPARIEVGADRAIHQRWTSNQFDFEALRHRNGLRTELKLAGQQRRCGQQQQNERAIAMIHKRWRLYANDMHGYPTESIRVRIVLKAQEPTALVS